MEKRFMKGCEAIAESAIRAGCRFFAGYPITPQNEIPEYMARRLPEVGGVFVQGESEVASINMVYGASCAGARAMTSSSSPGISLKAEGISYLAQTKLPAVIANVSRCGPGLGGILPAQSDYLLATKASGHGGFKMIVLAPSTVQEAVDLTYKAFDYADRDRNPVMLLVDGVIGIMMESVVLPDYKKDFPDKSEWILGNATNREPRQIIPMCWDAITLEKCNKEAAKMYERWEKEEISAEQYMVDDAEYIIVAYGTTARICKAAIKALRKENIKIGLIRPIILNPFPYTILENLNYSNIKKVITAEMTIPSQLIMDVRIAVKDRAPIATFGRSGGVIPLPDEIINAIKNIIGEEM